ncbi:hypothetical protein MuYL_3449 [Mucilaginibacter xinganensis]|uniref:Uncharacterized protein n=1 Tax=Mucilaginibacter xinganensis TaxID=1234841 RepID=A0A223P042_9SPHI|nr:hypothetical protein MuYL_3449 [Mucilaginibacter xinganensis]
MKNRNNDRCFLFMKFFHNLLRYFNAQQERLRGNFMKTKQMRQ